MDQEKFLKNFAKLLGDGAEEALNKIEESKKKENDLLQLFSASLSKIADFEVKLEDFEKEAASSDIKKLDEFVAKADIPDIVNSINNIPEEGIIEVAEELEPIKQFFNELVVGPPAVVANTAVTTTDIPDVEPVAVQQPEVLKLAEPTNTIPANLRKELDLIKKSVEDFKRLLNRQAQQVIVSSNHGGGEVWLHRLDDVSYQSLKNANDGQVLTYNASTKKWEAQDSQGGGGTGYRGSVGFSGSIGTQGYQGSSGLGGSGYSGSVGYAGSSGNPGGDTGYTGSTGSQGAAGYAGSQGSAGTNGFTGSTGTIGVTGYTGSKGNDGNQGITGFTGSKGDTGYVGSAGYIGADGYTGSRGYTGSLPTGITSDQVNIITLDPGYNFVPSSNNLQNLGTLNNRFKDLYLSGNSIYIGTVSLSDSNGNLQIITSNGSIQQVGMPISNVDGQSLYTNGSATYWHSLYTLSDTPPLNPNYGDIWYYTTDSKPYMWVNDGGGSFWLDFLPSAG